MMCLHRKVLSGVPSVGFLVIEIGLLFCGHRWESQLKLLPNEIEKLQIYQMRGLKMSPAVFAVLALAFPLLADLTRIGTSDATNYYNKEMIVTGHVAQVSLRSSVAFLNMDRPYPNSPFTLVIFNSATNQFGNLASLKGMSVEARGKIISYHNRPEIVLEKSNQLNVIGPEPSEDPSSR